MKRMTSFLFMALMVFGSSVLLLGQPKYRTFNQTDLADKKASKFGDKIASIASFKFRNTTALSANSLHAKFNARIEAVLNSGGFTTVTVADKQKLDASGGITVGAGDSVVMTIRFFKGDGSLKAEKWWWDTNGVRVGTRMGAVRADTPVTKIFGDPNGGTVRDYIYKKIIHRPNGLLVGMPTDTPSVWWIRYKTADRKYFPHTDSSRCFDYLKDGLGHLRRFAGELKNPHVKKHNNHLLGQVHALKLAIIANDSGVTEPLDASTRLGDLTYNAGGSDPCNGLKVREITRLADSALTYCNHFAASFYFDLDSSVSRIINAFDGPYVALTIRPMTIAGTNTLPSFLTPSLEPVIPHYQRASQLDNSPDQFTLRQNFPNPFNPSTMIEFNLTEPSVVTLKVYNLIGQEVATLINQEFMDDGSQSVEFNAANLPSGVYVYRISVQGAGDLKQQFQAFKKMVLLK